MNENYNITEEAMEEGSKGVWYYIAYFTAGIILVGIMFIIYLVVG